MTTLLLVHAGATLMMAGLIWFVQVVHYPLFARLHPATSVAYAEEHMRRTTWVVAPLMLVEAAAAALLVWATAGTAVQPLAWAGLVLLAFIWASTAWLCVPCHARLACGFDATIATRLVRVNWIRTAAWSGRSLVALWLLAATAA